MIERIYQAKIEKSLAHFPVVGIVGPRQCGKTTLAKKLMKSSSRQFVYIDCEHPRDLAKLSDPALFLENNIDKCVVIDEVQMKPELFPILRSMIDIKREPGRYIVLGSASPDLIRDSSESLAGRISYKQLSPFNILEISNKIGLNDHWYRGGFPDALLQEDNEVRNEWFVNFIKNYVERDLPFLGLGLSPNAISRFWRMLATVHGSLLNKSNLSKSLEMSYPTISRYLDFMEEAFLITQLLPYHVNLKKRLVKSPKIYLRDSGILHYQLSIQSFDELQGHFMLGVSWEGYIIEQIKQVLGTGNEMFFYRTHEGTEIDLVITRNNKPLFGVEIKYTSSPSVTKSMKIAIDDLKTEKNFIIIPSTEQFYLRKDIIVCSLETFLDQYIRTV